MDWVGGAPRDRVPHQLVTRAHAVDPTIHPEEGILAKSWELSFHPLGLAVTWSDRRSLRQPHLPG